MLKTTLAAGTVVLTLASAGFALAQHSSRGEHHRFRPSAEDRAAFTDARIAALKAGLKLNADQEKNWPAVETAMRDLAKQRADRMQARAERMKNRAERRAERDQAQPNNDDPARSRPDIIARLRRGADAMETRGTALKKLADAAEPLYNSLDDGQKRRFAVLLRMGSRGREGFGHHHWQRRADNDRLDGQRFDRGGHRFQERNSDQRGDD